MTRKDLIYKVRAKSGSGKGGKGGKGSDDGGGTDYLDADWDPF